MGAIFKWLISGLKFAGPTLLGVYFNEIATWIASFFPNTNVRDSKGGWSVWFVVAIAAVVGAAGLLIFSMFSGRKKIFSLSLLACFVADLIMPGISVAGIDYVAAGVLGVIPASSTGSFSIDFCPEILIFESADFSSFRIEVKDDGQIFSMDTNGIVNLKNIGFVGSDTTTGHDAYKIANGYVNKTTTITATNTNVAARTIRGFSKDKAAGGPNGKGLYTEFGTTKAFANVEFRLKDFSFVSIPTAGLTDLFTIVWRTGKSDNLNANELRVLLASTQFVEGISVDNRGKIISEIRYTGTTDKSVYYTRMKGVL